MKLPAGIAKMLESPRGDPFQHGAVLHELASHRYGVSDRKTMTMGMQLQIHPLLRQRLQLLHGHQTKKPSGIARIPVSLKHLRELFQQGELVARVLRYTASPMRCATCSLVSAESRVTVSAPRSSNPMFKGFRFLSRADTSARH